MSGVVEFRTSGSSGKPKVIRKAESMLAADAAMLACHFENEWFAEPAMCRVLTTLSCDYMYGRLWLGQLMPAVGVTDVRRIDGLEALLAEQTAAERVRLLLITTPAFLAEVLEHPLVERVRPIFSAVVTSGSFLSESLAMRVKARFGVAPTEIYGSTETGSVAWRRQDEGAQWTLFPGVNAESTEHGVKVCSPFCLEGTWELRDRVEFEPLNDRRFLLLERLDRRVKVLERWWISLPEVETALRAHPWVNEVAAVPSPGETVRVWALVTLSVKGVAEVSRLGYTKSVRALREALSAGGLHFAGIPRRIRFVPELPYNARGKLPMGVIQATVAQAWQYPLFERTIKRKEVAEARVMFPLDHRFFDGHFPEFPVLPGVGQLVFLRAWIYDVFGVFADGDIIQLKFQQVIQPGQWLDVCVERQGEDVFSFAICREGVRCTGGKISVRRRVSLAGGKTE